jgi:moderate conductance mechanosensitive channel
VSRAGLAALAGDPGVAHVLGTTVPDWVDRALGPAVRIVVVLLAGALVRFAVHRLIDRLAEQVAAGGGGLAAFDRLAPTSAILSHGPLAVERRQARARAIGSVLKSVATGLVAGVVALMVVQEFYDIGPLLAGAGILGLTLGLGAQSVVRDFLAGIFMIIEDQYGVGDTIQTGDVTGTVESVGLRVTRVRDDDGAIWYLRNGDIQRLGNRSQGWSRATVQVAVGYGEDLDQVRRLVLETAREVLADPGLAELVEGEPAWSGVQRLGPSAVQVQLEVRTRAGQDAAVARAVRAGIARRLAADGIQAGEPKVE